jgi:hypothetical protein
MFAMHLMQDFVPWGSVQCVAAVDFFTKLVVMVLVPPALLLLLALGFLLPLAILERRDVSEGYSGKRVARQRLKHQLYKCWLFTLFLM